MSTVPVTWHTMGISIIRFVGFRGTTGPMTIVGCASNQHAVVWLKHREVFRSDASSREEAAAMLHTALLMHYANYPSDFDVLSDTAG